MDLSWDYIEDAEKNLSIGCHKIVVISSYTAMFHAGRAILFGDGVKERSHECIPLYIKETYPELEVTANLLDSYRKARHETLYGLESEITMEDGKAALLAAIVIFENIDDFLKTKFVEHKMDPEEALLVKKKVDEMMSDIKSGRVKTYPWEEIKRKYRLE